MRPRRERAPRRERLDPALRLRRVRPVPDARAELAAEAWRAAIGAVGAALLRELEADTLGAWTTHAELDLRLDGNDPRAAIDRVRDLFERGLPPEVIATIDRLLGAVTRDVDASLRRIPTIDPARLVGGRVLSSLRAKNIALVRDATRREIDNLDLVVRSLPNAHVRELTEAIREQTGRSKDKARLWARDQTLKLNADVTRVRHAEAGITRYMWTTVGATEERVRPMHRELEGTIHDWNDPPVTNPQGDRNHPGEDYQCRCIAYPMTEAAEELL